MEMWPRGKRRAATEEGEEEGRVKGEKKEDRVGQEKEKNFVPHLLPVFIPPKYKHVQKLACFLRNDISSIFASSP